MAELKHPMIDSPTYAPIVIIISQAQISIQCLSILPSATTGYQVSK